MIHLTYSNRTEALLDRLADAVRAERAGRGPWEPVHLVAPNPHLKEYMRIQLARRLGVAANLRFTFLEGAWRGLMPDGAFRLLSTERLQGALLSVLHDEAFLADPRLARARHYLQGDALGLKALQLSGELAHLMQEYARSRPEWIPAWREDRDATPDPGLETWQRLLWREALRRLDALGVPHLVLEEALRHPDFGSGALPPALHLFGLTHVAQVYHQAYTRLGELTELHLYALNPCGEFWEDLTSTGETLWRASRPRREAARRGPAADPGDPEDDVYALAAEGPEALRRWGRPGRENIRLLNDVSGCDFTPCFEDPGGETLLHRVQRDILRFQDPAGPPSPPDGSLRFLACPSPRREAEAVATAIWRLMEAAPAADPLSFSDIAVLVPPAQEEAYLAHLQAAFLETRHIPWTRGAGATSVMAQTLEAAELLLALPGSGFTRAAVLRILSHPALRAAFPEASPGTWARWCEALGIVRGADREDWAGTYLGADALNWDQGLRRLALGAFMAESSQLEVAGEAFPVLSGADLADAGRFLALARGLVAEARSLLHLRAPLPEWLDRFETFLGRWLQGDDELVVKALERIRTFMRRLGDLAPEGLDLPDLGYEAARHLALEAAGRLRAEHPSALLRGVVVSSYAPMRAIPCRAVFLMGMGEGVFPGRDVRMPLDLRAKGRRRGDVSQTEKDRYLFLETLLCARDHLVCSYVAKDELSGEDLEPSSLFKEFRDLASRYLDPAEAGALVERHPLRRFDAAYFPGLLGGEGGLRCYAEAAEHEAFALALGRDLRKAGPLAMPPALGDLGAPPALLARLQAWLAHPGPAAGAPRPPLRLTLSDLRAWLECPLSGAARVRLAMGRDGVEDRSAMEEEPFTTEFLDRYGLLREVALDAARAGADPEPLYDRAVARMQARAAAPFGIFGAREREADLDQVRVWTGLLGGAVPQRWRIGAGRGGEVDREFPAVRVPVELEGRTVEVEVAGDLQPQALGGSLCLESGGEPALAAARRKGLRALLDHVLRACATGTAAPHEALFLCSGDGKKPAGVFHFTLEPLEPEAARERLRAWVQDLLAGDHAVLMPIEAVLDGLDKGVLSAPFIRAWVREKLDKDEALGGSFSTLRGPVPAPWRLEPPPDPVALVEARLGDYLRQAAAVKAWRKP
ncbi:MAG TPA: exodeoxyribonuclease V subunit gamma [Holophaga sp.]|nr:exodeoxyribonuclease V subunit gamma [Holophaga sp.]